MIAKSVRVGQPHAERLALEPVAVQLRDPGKEEDGPDLGTQQPQRPGGDGLPPARFADRRVHRPDPVRGHDREQEREQAHEVEVVEVPRLLEQEHVREADEEERRRDAVEETERDASGQRAEHREQDLHPAAGEWFDPAEPVIREMEARLDPVALDPVMREVAVDLPHHDRPEQHPENGQRRPVNRLEEAVAELPKKAPRATLDPGGRRSARRFGRGRCLRPLGHRPNLATALRRRKVGSALWESSSPSSCDRAAADGARLGCRRLRPDRAQASDRPRDGQPRTALGSGPLGH